MVIGLCGYKGSGKSAAAKYIAEAYKFKRINFKDALIDFMKSGLPDVIAWCSKHYDMTEEELFNNKPELFRLLMQNIGTDTVRNLISQSFWTERWKDDVAFTPATNIVVDDVRFINELDAVKDMGGIIIRVIRSDILSGGEHSSEKEQETFDADFNILSNKGNLESLYHQIDSIMSHISSD